MILEVVALFDSKARAYLVPAFVPHLDVVIRELTHEVNRAGSQLHKYTGDFQLYHLGKYNDETAGFALFPEAKHVCTMTSLRFPAAPGGEVLAVIPAYEAAKKEGVFPSEANQQGVKPGEE